MEEETQILEDRKAKIFNILKKSQNWLYYIGLAIVVWFGAVYIRTANIAKLKDVTGGLALAPDLDPYLFLRWAKIIVENGSLGAIDMFRYAPLGYSTTAELPVIPYGIAYLHKILSFFSKEITVEYAAIIFPVIFFALTLIAFFLMVKKIFEKNKFSNLIALISTFLIAIIPGFVHRTVAGVPEKESAAFFFMFLAFYLLVYAWRTEGWKKASILSFISGITVGLMGLTWGGVGFSIVLESSLWNVGIKLYLS